MEVKSDLAPNGEGVGNPRLKMSLGESVWAPGRSREEIQACRKKEVGNEKRKEFGEDLAGERPESLGRRL